MALALALLAAPVPRPPQPISAILITSLPAAWALRWRARPVATPLAAAVVRAAGRAEGVCGCSLIEVAPRELPYASQKTTFPSIPNTGLGGTP